MTRPFPSPRPASPPAPGTASRTGCPDATGRRTWGPPERLDLHARGRDRESGGQQDGARDDRTSARHPDVADIGGRLQEPDTEEGEEPDHDPDDSDQNQQK